MRSEGRKPADIKNLPNDAAPQAKDRSQQVSSHNQAAVNDQVLEEILSQLQTECHHLHQVRDRCNAWTTAYLKAMDEEEPNLDVNKALFLLISARLLVNEFECLEEQLKRENCLVDRWSKRGG